MREKLMKSTVVNGGEYYYANWHADNCTDSSLSPEPPAAGALPLLLVHGITASHMAWPRFVRSLGGKRCLLAPDLRGRGKNAALPGPFGFPQHIEDILRVMDSERVEQAIWVGHSLGAYIGLDFAFSYPDRLAALILVDGGIALPLREGKTPEQVIKAILGPALARLEQTFSSRENYHEFWRNHPAFQDADGWNDDMLAYADYDLTGVPPLMRSVVNPKAVEADSYYPMAPEMVSRIDEVTLPTLLLTAPRGLLNQKKPLLPKEAVINAADRNPHLQTAEISNTNHYSILTGSGAGPVAGAVSGFLQQHGI